ncbi:hypothetical protein CBR_g17614 [Chara braunii]|uniref:Uncharacterized protein n=1 Tax=Chara braunii TaxID=69332 RepID=A0A388KV21_CHABU|nr:hypothetical protein CBR_g17614 [Chara braunii]|eukprot:GBG73899.1 hypothetical protein CBR_g17614 [Chara braunii]
MPEYSGLVDGTGKVLILKDLIAAIERHEKTLSNVPKVDTFHFSGERVSDWLDLVEQALVGLSDAIKFQRILNSCGGGQAPPGQMVPYWGLPASAGPPSFPATQVQFTAQPPTSQQASQASVAGGGGQGQGGQGNGGRRQGGRGGGDRGRNGGGRGGDRGRNGGGRGGGWNGQGGQNQGGQGGQEGSQGYGRPHFDWRNAICRHCGNVGHTIRFRQERRDDELSGLISTNMDGDIYDKFGQYIDPKIQGGVRQDALRRVAAGPAPPAMFRLWQEREDPPVRVEEVIGENEEVTQRLKVVTIKEEPTIVESDDEDSREVEESGLTILEKMEDLPRKVGRY